MDEEAIKRLKDSMLTIGRTLPVGMECQFYREVGDSRVRMQIIEPNGKATEYAFVNQYPLPRFPLSTLLRESELEAQLADTFDLVAHIQRQREFSAKTFGPGRRTAGVSDHIRKELEEIALHPDDLEEWVDVILLALDGAWRTGADPQQIASAITQKLAKNEVRHWPDWRLANPDEAIEHVRDPMDGPDE